MTLVIVIVCIIVIVALLFFFHHQNKLKLRARLMREAVRNHEFTFHLPVQGLFYGERALQEALNDLGQDINKLAQQKEVESWQKLTRVLTHEIMNVSTPIQSISQAYGYAQAYGYPSYGNFNNGQGNFNHQLLIFNADLVMGDLYLLRGATQTDYEKAAYHYHRYLNNDCNDFVGTNATAQVNRFQRGEEEPIYSIYNTWGSGRFYGVDWGSRNYIRTAVPSAANEFFGKVLTSIPQIYGFETNSGAHSTTGTTSEGEEQTTTSGQINVTANYKMRQLEPSPAFEALCRAQTVVYNEMSTTDRNTQVGVEYPASLYDARFDESAPKVATEIGRIRFIDKYCGADGSGRDYVNPGAFSFRYGIPLYRTRQIYLKYAEAINRAGYPRHAFAILRDGLEPEKLPTIGQLTVKSDTIWVEEPNDDDPENPVLGDLASVVMTYDVVADSAAFNNGGANCIDLNELYRAKDVEWLNFENFENKKNVGIHQAGCGKFTNWDTEFTYENAVGQRILQERERSGRTLSDDHALVTNVDAVPGKTKNVNRDLNGLKDYYDYTENVNGFPVYGPPEDEIAAVETLIADEMAIGMINHKTTAVRVIPVPGKGVGDEVSFGGLLGKAAIIPVTQGDASAFIGLGGRIPAPIHSLKN